MNSKQAKEYLELQKARFIIAMAPEMLLATNEAISALGKQVPKKPEYYDNGDYARCTECGNDNFEYGINNWGCKYCPDCGQALDWGDDE